MDDLTLIKGVGAATAKKLVDAGLDNYAKLAALKPEDEKLLKIAATAEQASGWISGAQSLAIPSNPNTSAATGLAELVKSSAHDQAGAAVDTAPADLSASADREGLTGDIIEVRAPHPRRRAGYSFGPVPVEIDVSELSEEQMKALMNDPVLIIRPAPVDEADD